MTRRRRQRLAAAGVATVVAGATLVGLHATGTPVATPAKPAEAEVPAGLAGHLEKLRRAVPGNGGESREGPGSAEADAFAARAYPADTISLAKWQGAAGAFQAADLRANSPAARAEAVASRWVSVGPSRALYPFTPLRNNTNYVPNTYVAGGRTTSLALSPICRPGNCRMWVTPAGGGVWRTNDALVASPAWRYLGGPLGINAAGEVSVDPNDPTGNTIYVGTGEANVCGSGCVAGVGLYKSTNGGDSWQGPLGRSVLSGKGIGAIRVVPGSPRTIYVGTTSALRGMSSVCCDGVTRPVPDAAKWGLYKSTDGGVSWRFIHNGSPNPARCTGSQTEYSNSGVCSPRGVRHVELDPVHPNVVYASSYARGVWRSRDGGGSWTRIKPSLNPLQATSRAAIAVTKVGYNKTRMYVHEGNIGDPYSRLFRSDDVATGAPTFRDLTSSDPADSGYATYNQCTGQCWYDLFVYTPKGFPNVVYTGGSYSYDETGGISNGRGVVLSTDAGVSGTDMTMDGTDRVHPNGLHPDQHDLVTVPGRPFQFFEANDGGVSGSDGAFVSRSADCAARGLEGAELTRCQQLLSRVPRRLDGKNNGLNTLQFLSLSVSPFDSDLLQGGTQDNGTWQTNGNRVTWRNTMIGDGGQSGFDARKPNVRFHNFFDVTPEVNFDNGDTADWIWTADPLFGIPGNQFYAPVISDPRVSGTMFAGTGFTVHRTKTHGLGSRSLAEANRICNTWTGTFEATCGDWEELGPARLTGSANVWGDRAGGAVSAVERTRGDTSTAWAATTTGRVFVSKNIAAEPATSVRFTRVDNPRTPNRFVSSIHVDPANPNRAWVSYSGFGSTTPAAPGHVYQVVFNPADGTARWTDLSHDLRDLPITDLVRDDATGDLYASSDFGVLRLAAGTGTWTTAARGLPNVEVAGLTILPRQRILYAATHGLSAWKLQLRG
jgi:hypothetical protein